MTGDDVQLWVPVPHVRFALPMGLTELAGMLRGFPDGWVIVMLPKPFSSQFLAVCHPDNAKALYREIVGAEMPDGYGDNGFKMKIEV